MILAHPDTWGPGPKTLRSTRSGTADLHCHTSLSDGTLSVEALIQLAARKGISCLSITDHDNVDSHAQGSKLAADLGIELIPGIELSSVHQGKDIHILGYFCDATNLAMNLELEEQTKVRHTRVRAIVKKLNTLGIELTYEKVLTFCKGPVIGRPHIAMAMVAEEYVSNFAEAFHKYLAENAKAYVEKKGMSPQQAIRLIENAGGIAVLAHPMKTDADYLIEPLVEAGLKGLEIHCPGQKGNAGRKYRDFCLKYDLVGTGGSDYHSEGTLVGLGALKMPYAVVEALKERREKSHAEWF